MSKKQMRKQEKGNRNLTILVIVGKQSTWFHKLRKLDDLLHKTKVRGQNYSNPESSRTWLHTIQVKREQLHKCKDLKD